LVVACPSAGGVTGFGLAPQLICDIPEAEPQFIVTGLLNPFNELTVQLAVAVPPCSTLLGLDALHASEKSPGLSGSGTGHGSVVVVVTKYSLGGPC
jgi:hypothetical protein